MNQLKKAVTFSYDDGTPEDVRLVEIFNKYNLRATFNLNSGKFSQKDHWSNSEESKSVKGDVLKRLYAGHEIACHGTLHIHPRGVGSEQLTAEFDADVKNLEERFSTKIRGGAYAYGEYDEALLEKINSLGLKYMRTTKGSGSCDICGNLAELEPTCHHDDPRLMDIIESFLNTQPDKPQILYIWGHSFEFARKNNWERIEEICRRLSGREDIFYGTNTEVFEYFGLI